MFCLSVCVLFTFHTLSSAENILIVPVHGSKSHLGSMQPVINSLLSANYNLTLLWTTSEEQKERPNVPEEVHLIHLMTPTDESTQFNQEGFWSGKMTGAHISMPFLRYNKMIGQVWGIYEKEILSLVESQKWDLVITDELFSILGYALAQKMKADYGVPYTILSTTSIHYAFSVVSALGRSPVSRMTMYWYPEDPYVPYDPTKFEQRLFNFFDTVGEAITLLVFGSRFLIPNYSLIMGNYIQFEDLFAQHNGQFVEDMHRIRFPYPVAQDIVSTGHSCPMKTPTKLPAELEEFVMDPKSKGTIYVAFGSYVSWEAAPNHLKEAFEKALNSFTDYRIVFSGNASISFGNHVKTMKWAPQASILAHEKTKLFVTHGGLKSIKESVCSRIPMLIMAMFAEQSQNARLVRERGAAKTINKFTITGALLKEKISQLLNNPSYKEQVDRLYTIFTDEVVSARDRTVHATRCAISRTSEVYRKYKRKGLFQSWSQYLYLPQSLTIMGLIFCVSKQ